MSSRASFLPSRHGYPAVAPAGLYESLVEMSLRTPSSPHTHAPITVTGTMMKVLAALIPGIAAYIYFFGFGVVVQITLACATALLCEAAMLRLRGRALKPFLTDGSAVVTATLLAVALPPLSPWWLVVIGTAFAIVIAKHLYGGLGYNPFNPAMVGYALLLISFPREMTLWVAPAGVSDPALTVGQTLHVILSGTPFTEMIPDAVTQATALDTLKTELGRDQTVATILAGKPIYNALGGVGWSVINLGFLAGGLWLWHQRVISWHIPMAIIVGLFTIAGIFWIFDSAHFASPWFHLFSGATMIGAFFIATDPVTAATTPVGKLIYGAGIAVLIYIIRNFGGYPDAVAFAVLIMNMLTPTIDYYTQPRVFGHGKD